MIIQEQIKQKIEEIKTPKFGSIEIIFKDGKILDIIKVERHRVIN